MSGVGDIADYRGLPLLAGRILCFAVCCCWDRPCAWNQQWFCISSTIPGQSGGCIARKMQSRRVFCWHRERLFFSGLNNNTPKGPERSTVSIPSWYVVAEWPPDVWDFHQMQQFLKNNTLWFFFHIGIAFNFRQIHPKIQHRQHYLTMSCMIGS